MVVRSGRFGPYVTDGTTNASLRKGDEPETITIERAAELLADRRAAGPPVKRAGRAAKASKAAKKTTKVGQKTTKKATKKPQNDCQEGYEEGAPPPRRRRRGRPRRRERARPADRPRGSRRLREVDAGACCLAAAIGALSTAEPGATRLGATLRTLLLDPDLPPVSERAEALLMAADRAQHVAEVIAPRPR